MPKYTMPSTTTIALIAVLAIGTFYVTRSPPPEKTNKPAPPSAPRQIVTLPDGVGRWEGEQVLAIDNLAGNEPVTFNVPIVDLRGFSNAPFSASM